MCGILVFADLVTSSILDMSLLCANHEKEGEREGGEGAEETDK